MPSRRRHRREYVRLATGVLIALALLAAPLTAYAVKLGTVAVELSDSTALASGVSYTFTGFRTAPNQTVAAVTIQFATDTSTVTSAATSSPQGAVSVIDGRTVTVTFEPALDDKNSDIALTLNGVTNPASVGTHTVERITFSVVNLKPSPTPGEETYTSAASYTIIPEPTLSISVDSANLDFGTLLPGDTPPAQNVNVTVVAGMAYTMTRTISGDASDLGVVVTGTAEGAKAPGTFTYAEAVTVAPGWDAPADTTLTAQILYSVTP